MKPRKFSARKALNVIGFVIAMASVLLHDVNAQSVEFGPTEYRVSVGDDKIADTWQFAMAYRIGSPRILRAQHLELTVGTIFTSRDNALFVSLGPVWRLPINSQSMFIDLGISPTLISGSSFNGRDMGGNFHFTSSAAIGAYFGARDAISLALRIQHTSNGGISSTNPGMDMIGINFAFDLSRW